MIGEQVTVTRRMQTGVDRLGDPVYEDVSEVVDDVLVAPGPRSDLSDAERPDGDRVAWNLHFPKPYESDLRNATVSVRGEAACLVVGEPRPFTLENTPTRWWMPVELWRVDG